MTDAPEILYKITWKFDGLPERTALAAYTAADEIRRALLNRSHGVLVSVTVAPAAAPTGRHSAPPPPVDEPLTGAAADRVRDRLRRSGTDYGQALRDAGELDASDRTAVGRLARRAFRPVEHRHSDDESCTANCREEGS